MKKIHILCAAAAALVLTTSCEEILNVIATTPTFSVTDEVYDGQTQQLQKLGTCKYAWSTDSPSIVTFKDEEEGSKVITYATFKLTAASKPVKVSITAKNAEDESVDPVTNSTTVRIWTVHFFKNNGGDKWEELPGYNNPTVNEAGTYRAQMVAMQDDNSWERVSVINYKFSLTGGAENGNLKWSTAGSNDVALGDTYANFTVSTKGTYTFQATLGDDTRVGVLKYQ